MTMSSISSRRQYVAVMRLGPLWLQKLPQGSVQSIDSGKGQDNISGIAASSGCTCEHHGNVALQALFSHIPPYVVVVGAGKVADNSQDAAVKLFANLLRALNLRQGDNTVVLACESNPGFETDAVVCRACLSKIVWQEECAEGVRQILWLHESAPDDALSSHIVQYPSIEKMLVDPQQKRAFWQHYCATTSVA